MNIKWSIVWVLLHSLSIYFSSIILDLLSITGGLFFFVLLGLFVTLFAGLWRTFTRKKSIVLNKQFFVFFIINTLVLCVANFLNSFFNIQKSLIIVLISSLLLVLSASLIFSWRPWKFKTGAYYLFSFILILLIFFFASMGVNKYVVDEKISLNLSENLTFGQKIDNAFYEIKSIFSFNSLSCPQIAVDIRHRQYLGYSFTENEYDGWTIKGSGTCRKGSKEGENLNYIYCGGIRSTFGIGTVDTYITKTDIGPDGSIGSTHKHIIWNVYDENENFLRTECLGNPDKFEEREAKKLARAFNSWS